MNYHFWHLPSHFIKVALIESTVYEERVFFLG